MGADRRFRIGTRFALDACRPSLRPVNAPSIWRSANGSFAWAGISPRSSGSMTAGRVLTETDITHYRKMLASLRETSVLLPSVDAVFTRMLGG